MAMFAGATVFTPKPVQIVKWDWQMKKEWIQYQLFNFRESHLTICTRLGVKTVAPANVAIVKWNGYLTICARLGVKTGAPAHTAVIKSDSLWKTVNTYLYNVTAVMWTIGQQGRWTQANGIQ